MLTKRIVALGVKNKQVAAAVNLHNRRQRSLFIVQKTSQLIHDKTENISAISYLPLTAFSLASNLRAVSILSVEK